MYPLKETNVTKNSVSNAVNVPSDLTNYFLNDSSHFISTFHCNWEPWI